MSEAQAAATTEATAAVAAPVEAAAPTPTLMTDPPATESAPAPVAAAEPENPAADALPETYVVTLPEGETVDTARLDAYQGALKDAALTQAQADKLTPFLLGQMKAIHEQQMTAWADQTKAWAASVMADPEVGGARWADSRVAAARARDAYGSPEFKALLADSNIGIGNHPAVVKFLVSVGRGMGEDLRGAERQSNADPASRDRSMTGLGARMFPNMAG